MSDVALCLLFDSSVTLLNNWVQIVQKYISALLTALVGGRANDSFNISVITYSTSDCRPSPILAKRYFAPASQVSMELRSDPAKLGIGMTGSSSRHGLAALEAYAACIELFDLFLKNHPSSRDVPSDKVEEEEPTQAPLCHLLHVCATDIDDAKRPLWNSTSCLDNLSWKTMPEELRRRKINLNSILLKPNKLITELHASLTSTPAEPWFPVANGHIVKLASQSSWAPLKTTKRPNNETNHTDKPDKASDAKRPRIQPPQSSTAGTAPSTTPAPSASAASQTQQAVPPQNIDPKAMENLRRLASTIKALETGLNADKQQAQRLMSQGLNAEVEALKQRMLQKLGVLQRLRQSAINYKAQLSGQIPPPGSAGQSQAPNQVAGPSNLTNAQVLHLQQLSLLQQARNQTAQLNANAATNANAPTGPNLSLPPNMQLNPNMAAQMQKLQMKEGIQGVQTQSHPQGQLQQAPFTGTSAPQPGAGPNNNTKSSWMGTFSFRTPHPMEIHVILTSRIPINIHSELWPEKPEFELSPERAVNVDAIKEWLTKYRPVICAVIAASRGPDAQGNEQRYKDLVDLMSNSNRYAVASWRPPGSGDIKPMLMLFSSGSGRAVAAVFPETGVPEFPRIPASTSSQQLQTQQFQHAPPQSASSSAPNTSGGGINPNHARIIEMLQRSIPPNIPLEQRQMFIMAKVRQLAAAQAANANAQQANASSGMNNTNPNSNPNPNMNANPNPQQQQPSNQGGINPFQNFGNLGGMGGLGLGLNMNPGSGGGFSTSAGSSNSGMVSGGGGQQWSSPAPSVPGSAGSTASTVMPNMNFGGMNLNNMNISQALAAMAQQQRQMQGGMGAPPGSGGQQRPF